MASPSPPLPTQIRKRTTNSINSIHPIFQNHTHSQISLLGNRKPLNTIRAQFALPKLVRRNLLFTTLGGLGLLGGSKMSEKITGDVGESANAAETSSSNKVVQLSEFPITLDSVISVIVPRPKKSRTKKEKQEEEEVLAIQGIEFVADEAVNFHVHVNDDEEALSRPDKAEFAGSFMFLPTRRRKEVTTSLRLGLTDLLEDVGADDDDTIKVTLVPKHVKRPVTIRHLKIEFLK